MEEAASHRLSEGAKVLGVLRNVERSYLWEGKNG